MAYAHQEDSKKYIRTSLLFEHIIDDPIWMPYLLEFLSKHKQPHLLFFWLEVELFERIAGGGPDLVAQAKRLYDTYLSEDAPQRIEEVPPRMLAFIKAELALGVPNINMFTAAQVFVFKTLQGVWYPSFLLSATYQALLDHLRKAFNTPLREVLFDEVQSRYLEAFLLSGMSRQPPSAVGNMYLYKKIHYDIKPLGARLIRDKSGNGDRAGDDLRLLLADSSAAYHNFLFTPTGPTPGGDSKQQQQGGGGPPKANATAIPLEARRRVADCLNRLIAQSNYYSSMGSRLPRDNSLISELVGLFTDVQRAIHTWLEVEVYPDFRKSWFCGILSGDAQSKLSAPVRRKRRLRNLFKSVRTFRHAYVPPCQRSEGQGLVLVSTENVTPPPAPLSFEFVWSFNVGVDEAGGSSNSASSSPGKQPSVSKSFAMSDEDDQSDGSLWGAIVSQKAGGHHHQGTGSVGGRQGTRRFRSSIRSSQVMATELLVHEEEQEDSADLSKSGRRQRGGRRRKVGAGDGDGEEEEEEGDGGGVAEPDEEESALCTALEAYLGRCVQRYALPSLCLLPLEHSTFVLFSPKLVVPEPSIHHFCVAVPRSALIALTALLSPRNNNHSLMGINSSLAGGGLLSTRSEGEELDEASPLNLVTPSSSRSQRNGGGLAASMIWQQLQSPRSPVVDPQSGTALEPPDLSEEAVYLYGASLLEWDPDDEALLPRCLTLVSTQPRLDSLRSSLVNLREARLQQQQQQSSAAKTGGDDHEEEEEQASPPLLANTRPPSRYRSSQHQHHLKDKKKKAPGTSSSSSSSRPPLLTPHPSPDQPTLDGPLLPLFQALSPDVFARVLAALLLERPVILRSATHSLAVVCAEALRSLLYPFSWLHPYQPLLPVSSICTFWERIKVEAAHRRSWGDYYFEDDALDDSLSPGGGGDDYYYNPPPNTTTSHGGLGSTQQQPQPSPSSSRPNTTTTPGAPPPGSSVGGMMMNQQQQQYFPPFLVGMDAAVIDAAMAAPPKGVAAALSPAYRGDRQCRAWACDECPVHSDWGGQAPLSTGSSPAYQQAHATPVSRSFKPQAGGGGGGNPPAVSTSIAAARQLSLVKHGELPPCVRTSVREMVGEALVVDLDRDTIEDRGGGTEPSATSSHLLPALPDEAARVLFREIRRCAYPQLEDYGHRQACTARAKKQQQQHPGLLHKQQEAWAAAGVAAEGGGRRAGGGGDEGQGEGGAGGGGGGAAAAVAAAAGGSDPCVDNAPIHEAFLTFYRTILLARYREFTLSYLDDRMVCFFADAFLASQPQHSHPFWDQFLRTRMFAHFLYLEHQRLEASAEEPPPPPTPRALPSPSSSSALNAAFLR